MTDERSRRRTTFQDGTPVQLADGQYWSLPSLAENETDPVVEELRRGIAAPSEEPERLRDELAMTILLLSRNYHLTPETFPQILGFRPGDPARGELQRTVRRVVLGASYVPRVELIPNVERGSRPSRRWGLSAASQTLYRVRSRWSARSR